MNLKIYFLLFIYSTPYTGEWTQALHMLRKHAALEL